MKIYRVLRFAPLLFIVMVLEVCYYVVKHDDTMVIAHSCYKKPLFKSWESGVVTFDILEVEVNCSRLISGDKEEIQRVSEVMSTCKSNVSDEDMLERVRNCSWVKICSSVVTIITR